MGKKIIKSRQSNFDLLRIISTISVVLIHVNATVANSNNISLVGFNICSLINIITRFSVPCFVMLSGLYFLVPIIIRIKNTISKKCYTIGSFVWLLVAMISQLTSTYSVAWSFGIIFSFVGYFLVGNVIYENMSRIKFKGLYFIFAIVSYALLFLYRGITGFSRFSIDAYSNWFSPLIIIASICVFIAFGGIKIKTNLGKLSGYTYVIYLLHTKVYIVLLKLFEKFIPSVTGNYIVYIAIVTILAFIISCVGAMVYDFLWSLLEKKFKLKEKYNNWVNKSK